MSVAWTPTRRLADGAADAERVALPGQQFPADAFDQFFKQGVPRWASTDPQILAAYNQLVQKVCPGVILVHSQSGNFGFNAALAAPDRVKALIAIEPSGAPRPEAVPPPQGRTRPLGWKPKRLRPAP